MVRLFTWDEVHKLVGEASKACAIKLLKAGKYGKRMTRANFKEHKVCIRDFFEAKVREKIAGLT